MVTPVLQDEMVARKRVNQVTTLPEAQTVNMAGAD